MTYEVRIAGRTIRVDLERAAASRQPPSQGPRRENLAVSVDGVPVDADLVRIDKDTISIVAAGRSYTFTGSVVERAPASSRVSVAANAGEWRVEVADPRRPAIRPEAAVEGPVRVTATIAGKVVRVMVQPGDQVTANQPLLVLEAMKMQNEVRTPKTGRVTRMAIKPGDTILSGALLAEIE